MPQRRQTRPAQRNHRPSNRAGRALPPAFQRTGRLVPPLRARPTSPGRIHRRLRLAHPPRLGPREDCLQIRGRPHGPLPSPAGREDLPLLPRHGRLHESPRAPKPLRIPLRAPDGKGVQNPHGLRPGKAAKTNLIPQTNTTRTTRKPLTAHPKSHPTTAARYSTQRTPDPGFRTPFFRTTDHGPRTTGFRTLRPGSQAPDRSSTTSSLPAAASPSATYSARLRPSALARYRAASAWRMITSGVMLAPAGTLVPPKLAVRRSCCS